MLRRLLHLIRPLALLAAVGGCAGTNFSELDFGASQAAEPAPAVSAAALTARYGGAYQNPALQGRLENVVSRLAKAAGQRQVYAVTVLNSPQINAFALENGQLFITRGLLAYTSSEDDAAAVLAHEMSHVILRHAAKRRAAVNRVLRNASLFPELGPPGEQQGDMSRNAFFRSAQYSIAEYTQVQELEADKLGQTIMTEAGFDARRAASLLVNMEREDLRRSKTGGQTSSQAAERFFSTHPSNSERISRARAFPVPASVSGGSVRLPDPDYLQALDGMTFGDAVENGFLRDGRFIHPILRIGFVLPAGYAGENTPDAVFAAGQEGQLIRFDADKLEREIGITDYLTLEWLKDIKAEQISKLEVAGREAALTRVSTSRAQFYFGAVKWSRSTVYRFMLIAPINDTSAEGAFTAMLGSLSPLPQDLAGQVRPLRIAVVKVPPEGAGALLRILPPDINDPAGFLAILNGVDEVSQLAPGALVKTVFLP